MNWQVGAFRNLGISVCRVMRCTRHLLLLHHSHHDTAAADPTRPRGRTWMRTSAMKARSAASGTAVTASGLLAGPASRAASLVGATPTDTVKPRASAGHTPNRQPHDKRGQLKRLACYRAIRSVR